LPRYRVLQRLPRWQGEEGFCDDERKTLFISSGLDPEHQRRVLLHEMCHIGTRGHGKPFLRKLTRLAQLGESWAEDQRKLYEETIEPPLTAQVKHAIVDLAMELPHLPWLKARKLIANRMYKSVVELRRIAPWAQKHWERSGRGDRPLMLTTPRMAEIVYEAVSS